MIPFRQFSFFPLAAALLLLTACHTKPQTTEAQQTASHQQGPTAEQQQLIDQGWQPVSLAGGELGEAYGIRPVYGVRDNYFDISMGKGCSVAVKVVDASSDRTIRYVYVPENTTVTINEIPQGLYYLKFAYGRDWMELPTDTVRQARFTRSVAYERTTDAYDFGRKNSDTFVNYTLSITIVHGAAEHNFHTEPISAEEFEKN